MSVEVYSIGPYVKTTSLVGKTVKNLVCTMNTTIANGSSRNFVDGLTGNAYTVPTGKKYVVCGYVPLGGCQGNSDWAYSPGQIKTDGGIVIFIPGGVSPTTGYMIGTPFFCYVELPAGATVQYLNNSGNAGELNAMLIGYETSA